MSRPWMPLYVADYLADTRRLTTLEHGAYLLLIMEYWRHGSLPDDDARLARIVGMDPIDWMEIRDNIAVFFDDGWRHKRVDEELKTQSDRSDAARASAARRWKGDKDANAMRTQCDGNAMAMQTQCEGICETDANHSHNHNHIENTKSVSRAARVRVTDGFDEFWLAYPNKVGKGAAEKAWPKAVASIGGNPVKLVEAVKAHKFNADPQYIPHPATWLNQKRWEDAPQSPRNDSGSVKNAVAASGVAPSQKQALAAPGKRYAISDSDEWAIAADRYFSETGKYPPRDSAGGWWFPESYFTLSQTVAA